MCLTGDRAELLVRWIISKNNLTGVTDMWYSKTVINKNSCLIYKGPFFTIEWYYDEKGYSQPYEYFLRSSAAHKWTSSDFKGMHS